MSSSTSKTPAITPRQTMRHTGRVSHVVHLPGGRRIITCSMDGSLRLWDLKSGTQIGEDWRDKNTEVSCMTLSPNGEIVASGCNDGKVRLWDVETRKVIAKWKGHSYVVRALCWSADGERVASGSWDGTTKVWDIKRGKNMLTIKTGPEHNWVHAVTYSPDSSKLATGGYERNVNAVKIWDARTGELLNTLEQGYSFAWTPDGKKLISGSYGLISIFDTATWQQIAILQGHNTSGVIGISLSSNNRLLASASWDKTARLWNLDTNLPVGPPLRHENALRSAALSPDGKVLVTACENHNAYTWDVHAILKEAGLEDLLPIGPNIAQKDTQKQLAPQGTQRTPRSSLSDKSFLEADATQCPGQFGGDDELPPGFFHGMEADVDSSPMGGAHPHPSLNALLALLASLFHRFRPDNGETTENPQPSRPSAFHIHALLARLSSLIHSSPSENDAPDELQQPSASSRVDPRVLLARLSSFLHRSRHNTDEEAEPHPTAPLNSRSDPLISRLTSIFRSQPHANEEIELAQRPRRPRVVDVAAVRDKQSLFVARRPERDKATQTQQQQSQSHGQGSSATPHAPGTNAASPGARPTHSRLVRLLAHLVLFLCCTSAQRASANSQPTQIQLQGQAQTHATSSQTLHHQGQPQGPPQAQASSSSSQTQPTAPSTSAIPTAPDAHTTAPGAASVQPRPLPLRTRFVLFLCCASLPHADGH